MASTVLVVTALEDFTADKVIAALNEREVPAVRVDPADIGTALTLAARIGQDSPTWGGRLRTASREVELGEVAAVYYRRPTPYAARYQHLPPQQRDFAAAEARHGLGGILNNLHGATYVNHPAAVTRPTSSLPSSNASPNSGFGFRRPWSPTAPRRPASSPPSTAPSSTRRSAACPGR
ncbi:MvdC/MvdD family ATP grasp protein [Streptomyces sp. NPDC059994]|uniref:MvdC/MvdD family ATP grasp protein n=1 Tax=Streptomyces sp. NPDC059994 TaxID=3347029 RepID=UPI00367DCD35